MLPPTEPPCQDCPGGFYLNRCTESILTKQFLLEKEALSPVWSEKAALPHFSRVPEGGRGKVPPVTAEGSQAVLEPVQTRRRVPAASR